MRSNSLLLPDTGADGGASEAGMEYEDEAMQADKGGQLHFRLSMPAWSLVLVKQM
jgi:hypothetical protein